MSHLASGTKLSDVTGGNNIYKFALLSSRTSIFTVAREQQLHVHFGVKSILSEKNHFSISLQQVTRSNPLHRRFVRGSSRTYIDMMLSDLLTVIEP